MPRVVCIIPARLASKRFPKKMLSDLLGKPLIQRVWEKATTVSHFDAVAIATDSEEIASHIRSCGGIAFMTDPRCPSGTDRLIEVMQTGAVHADIWVNWQGDQPFIHNEMIQELLQTCCESKSDIWTLRREITNPEDFTNPHITKIVCGAEEYVLYFSRSPIPHSREGEPCQSYKHVGLYAFTNQALERIASLASCALEEAEQLEQLRWLFYGLKIKAHQTQHEVIGIDLPEHLAQARIIMESVSRQKFLEGSFLHEMNV